MVRKKKQIKLKEPVRLREKKLKDGNRSLYLDIYSNGIRKYEYLKLYLVPEINETNSYLQDQEDEEIKLALGLTDNTHDLAIAQAKAQASLQYTVALRDRFMEAYKEIMQMQV